MKKIIALILALVMCCTIFVACGDKKSGASSYQDFEKAMKKTQALDDISVNLDMDIKVYTEGMSIEIPVDMIVKIKNVKSENPIAYVDLKMSTMGTDVTMEMYQEDGWGYYVSNGEKYKANLGETTTAEYTQNIDNLIQALPEDIMKNSDIEAGKNGSSTLTVELGEEDFKEIFGDYMENLGYSTEGATVKGASVTMIVKDGYLVTYEMNMEMEMTVEGVVAQAVANISATYDKPGKSVEITPIEGYKDFPEMSVSIN